MERTLKTCLKCGENFYADHEFTFHVRACKGPGIAELTRKPKVITEAQAAIGAHVEGDAKDEGTASTPLVSLGSGSNIAEATTDEIKSLKGKAMSLGIKGITELIKNGTLAQAIKDAEAAKAALGDK